MSKRIEVNPGDCYGRLTVINEAEGGRTPGGVAYRRVQCKCVCGNEVTTLLTSVRKGETRSCGCIVGRDSHPRHGHATTDSKTPTYNSWIAMRSRCYNVNQTTYHYYGGRGITICERWAKFEHFLEDMGERPEGTSIDRIDNDGDYEPGNCRWATRSQQAQNSRQSLAVTFNGETRNLREWARLLGMNRHTLRSRLLKAGWSVEKAMTTPSGPYNKTKGWK